MRPRLRRAAVFVALVLVGCTAGERGDVPPADAPGAEDAPADDGGAALPAGAEARSFLGEPLFPPELSPEVRAGHEQNLAAARADLEATPDDADALIWYGRRLAYLGRYGEAIAVYTRGLELHPDDARFRRHRGHRYLTVRDLDAAIADFQAALELVEGSDDEVEPDGLPNAAGIPTSTLHFNIWYHLGLAHYLRGEFEQALLAWNDCLEVSRHPDSVIATTYWLNNTLRRLGLTAQADTLLAGVRADAAIIESASYLDVLLLHKGEREPEELLGPPDAEANLASTTTAYGVAMWHHVNGRREAARQLFEAILAGESQWPAFGYLAAEAEVARAAGTLDQ